MQFIYKINDILIKKQGENSVVSFYKIIADSITAVYYKRRAYNEYRQYQVDTLHNLHKIRQNGGKRALIKLATGGGKTTIASMDIVIFAERFEKEMGRKPKILWLAHRKELLEQAEADMSSINDSEIEEVEARKQELVGVFSYEDECSGKKMEISTDINSYVDGVLVTSVQKLSREGNLDIIKYDFDYVVIDEAHHAYSDSYMRIINKFNNAFIVGLTATPQRFSDRRNVEVLFEKKALDLDLLKMIKMGYLTTMYFHKVETKVYLTSNNFQKGDFNLAEYWKKLGKVGQNQRDKLVVDTYLNIRGQKEHYARLGQGELELNHKAGAPAVTFAMNIAHAKNLTKLYQEKGVRAEVLHGKMSKKTREYVLGRYRGEVCEHAFSRHRNIDVNFSKDIREYLVEIGVLDSNMFSLKASIDSATVVLDLPEKMRWCEQQVREELFRHSEKGKIQMIVAIDILNEGYDYPAIEVALMARPTRSKIVYLQQIGRLSRKSDATGKHSALIIDFVDNMGKYRTENRPIESKDIFRNASIGKTKICSGIDGNIELVDIVEVDMEEIFGGYPESNYLTEMGITSTDITFGQLEGQRCLNGRLLRAVLDAFWEAKADKSKNELIYEGIVFYKRQNGPTPIWATDKANVSEVANILGQELYLFELTELDPLREMGVSEGDKTFESISNSQRIGMSLREGIEEAWERKEDKSINEVEYKGIVFFKRKKINTPFIWSTNKENLLGIAKLMGQTVNLFELIESDPAIEMGITGKDKLFMMIEGKKSTNAQLLREALDKEWEAKEDKSKNELIYKGIIFYKRQNGPTPIWVTDKGNLLEVANLLGKEVNYFEIPEFISAFEVGVTGEDKTFAQIPNVNKNSKLLREALDVEWSRKTDKSKNELIYKGIIFCKRMRGVRFIWATEKLNWSKIVSILGQTVSGFKMIDFDSASDMGITCKDKFFGQIPSINQNSKLLRKALDNEWERKADKSKNELIYKGIIFYKRRRVHVIWSTERGNLLKIANILGKELNTEG